MSGTAPNLTYIPNALYHGGDAFTFTVFDGFATSAPATVSITVNHVNHPPVLAPIGNRSVAAGSTLTFTISAVDVDGDALTYSATNVPPGASFDPSTRVFAWTPTIAQTGTYSMTFSVADGTVSDSEGIAIHVTGIVSDIDGDGHADILWRHTVNGANAAWRMNGTAFLGGTDLPGVTDTAWKIVGLADLDADGHGDIVWRNTTTGANAVWFLSGGLVTGTAALPGVNDPDWSVVSVADMTGDGKPDLIWRNTVTGANAVWELDGTTYVGAHALPESATPTGTSPASPTSTATARTISCGGTSPPAQMRCG